MLYIDLADQFDRFHRSGPLLISVNQDLWTIRSQAYWQATWGMFHGFLDLRIFMRRSVCDFRLTAVLVVSIFGSLVNGQQPANAAQSKTGLWTSIGSMSEARAGACAAQVQDGRVLIAGGLGSRGVLDSAELFDMQAGFSVGAAMATPRATPTCVTLQDGRVLIAGGSDAIGTAISGAEIYDPYKNNWSPAGDMAYSRSGHAAVRLNDGRVLIAGGEGQGAVRSSLEIFDPRSNSFSLIASATLAFPRKEHAAVALPDGRVLIAGGSDGSNALASTEIYDPATGMIALGPTLSSPRAGLSATVLMDGNVLIAGGNNSTRDLATAEIFETTSGTFVDAAKMTAPRQGQLAFLLPNNNQVLLIGGDQGNGTAELFTPWRNSFAVTGNVQQGRKAAAAAALGANGALMVSGGTSGNRVLDSSSLYRFATLKAEQEDYALKISGTGWQPGEQVALVNQQQPKVRADITRVVAADTAGNISDQQPIDQVSGKNTITATGTINTAGTTGGSTGANLDQCANADGPGGAATRCDATDPTDWVNGNLGASKARYLEGDSIPYRLVMTNVSTTGSHTVTIQWDTTKGGKHALDYVTTFNRSVPTADPCAGVTGCGAPTTYPIPADPNLANGFLGSQIAGNFTMYGGTITSVGVSPFYTLSGSYGGDSSTTITITFTANTTNPVLAWGGHIATRVDWGAGNSAIAITGSPYHTRLVALDGSGGNQDRSLSSDATIFPATITIIKSASVQSATAFTFTAGPSPLSNFSLWDDGSSDTPDATPTTKVFTQITNFTTYTVTEGTLGGWTGSVGCTLTSANGGSQSTSGLTATLIVKEGENYTCTYTNTVQAAQVKLTKILSPLADPGLFDLTVNGTTNPGQGNGGFVQAQVAVNSTASLSEASTVLANYNPVLNCPGFISNSQSSSGSFTVPLSAAGTTILCTITNARKTHTVTLHKTLSPTTDGGKFNLTINDGTATTSTDQGNGGSVSKSVAVGASVTLSETQGTGTILANYTASFACTGGTPAGATFTMPDSAVDCTLTNTVKTHTVTLHKTLSPTTDGGKFNLTINDGTATTTNDQGNGGSVSKTVAAGTSVTLSEAQGTSTLSANYTASFACTGGTPAGATFTMPDSDVDCTFTNTRKTHMVTLHKTLSPTTDGGKFNLTINDATATTNNDQGNGGSVSKAAVAVGVSVTLSEAQGTGTLSANYTASFACTGGTPAGATFTMPDSDVDCTFTNTRKTHTVTLHKTLSPTTDGGKFNLTINDGTATTNTDQGNGGSVSKTTVAVGASVTLSETQGTGTVLTDYSASFSCMGGTPTGASFTMPDSNVDCTFTNTLKTGTLTIYKICAPTTDTTTQFTINVTGPQNSSPTLVCNGQSQTITLKAGNYTVGETAKIGWTLGTGPLTAGWSAPGSFAGDCPGGAVTLNNGDNKVCGILNVNAVCTPQFPPNSIPTIANPAPAATAPSTRRR
jgi:hypothetical protein